MTSPVLEDCQLSRVGWIFRNSLAFALISPHEGGEVLAQAAQRSVQGRAGRGSEHPGLVEGVPAQGRGLERGDL